MVGAAASASPGSVPVLRDPLLRLNAATFLLSVTIYSPILVLFYTGRGLSLFQVLSLEALNSAVITLFQIPTGAIADRIGLKRIVFAGHALQGIWLIVLIASHQYLFFLLGYAVLGVAISLRSGATEAWVFEILKQRGETSRMTQVQGTLWAASLVGRIASALLSIVVVRRNSDGYFVSALALSAVAFFLSAAIIATVPNVAVSIETQRRSLGALVRDGLYLFRTRPRFRHVAIATVVTDPLPYALLFLYQPYFKAAGTPLALYGFAAAAAAAVGAVVSRHVHRLETRIGAQRAFLVCTVVPSLLYLAMALVFQAYIAAALYVVTFGVMQARYPLATALRNRHVESYNRATALSLISMLDGAWGFAAKLIVGRVADASLRTAFIVMGLVPLVTYAITRLRDDDVETIAET
ncbi:MAG: MFS transporter [Thermomicrobiales bacterium]